MPRLPSPEDFGTELPRGDRGFTQVTPDPTGGVVREFASRIEKMAEEEAARLDRINVQDALSELSDADTELTYGEKGFVRRDVDAVKDPKFTSGYSEQYQQRIDQIAAKLNRPQAREGFLAAANAQRSQFNRGVVTHLSRLVDKAQDVSNKTAVSKLERRIDYAPDALPSVLADMVPIHDSVRSTFPDSKSFSEYVDGEKGRIAAKAVQASLSQEQYGLAERYLNEYGHLMGDEASNARERLKTQKASAAGVALGTDAVTMHKAGKNPTEIADHVMRKAREADPVNADQIAKSAMADLDLYQRAEQAQNNQTLDGLYSRFTDGTRILTPAHSIRKDREFMALPAEAQNRLNKLMDGLRDELIAEGRAQGSAARERVADAEQRKRDDLGNQALVSELLYNPDKLAQMSLVDIAAMRTKIGNGYASALVDARTKVLKNAEGYKADKSAIEQVLAPITDEKKKKQMYLMVQPALETWKKLPENKGKTPDAKTLHQIVANTAIRLTEKKMLGNDQRYLWQYQMEGKLRNAYLETKAIDPKGVEQTVSLPGDFVQWALSRRPQLTDKELGKVWLHQTPAEKDRWGKK